MAEILRFEKVSYSYDGERDALKNVDVTIYQGRGLPSWGIMGQGKVPFSYVLTGFLSLRQERYSWTGKKFIGKNGRFWNCARR